LEIGRVDEVELERLLHLVDKVARQDHERQVGLADADGTCRVRKTGGSELLRGDGHERAPVRVANLPVPAEAVKDRDGAHRLHESPEGYTYTRSFRLHAYAQGSPDR